MKQKTIIVVQGVGDAGKSTSIKLACSKIKNAYPTQAADLIIPQSKDDIAPTILEINGVTIGICGKGDNLQELESVIKFTSTCSVIICAARSSGETDIKLKEYSFDFWTKWIRKTPSLPHAQAHDNQVTAKKIFEEFELAIR